MMEVSLINKEENMNDTNNNHNAVTHKKYMRSRYLKRTYMSAVAIVTALFFSLSPVTKVFATSAYDNTVNALSDIKYNNDVEGVISIAGNWRTHMHVCSGSSHDYAYEDFIETIDGGGKYAVTQEGTSDDYGVTVIWSPSGQVTSSSFATAGATKYLATNAGIQGKVRFHFNSTTDQDVCDYAASAYNNIYGNTLDVEGDSSQLGVYMSSFSVSYPGGYEGDTVPSASTITPLQNYVECVYGTGNINSVTVEVQSGINGDAILSGNGSSESFRYYLSEDSSYKLDFECGGGSQQPSPDSWLTTDNYTFTCTTICVYS